MKFQKADLSESSKAVANPGCGWYHLYSFVLRDASELSLQDARGSLAADSKEEQLALVLIDIGAFRTKPLSERALSHIEQIMEMFHAYGKQMILRFVYDTAGKGMEREPEELSLIKGHMAQTGAILRRHAGDILVIQGIFVGNWGEMHGSKFLGSKEMSELLCCLYESVEGSCYLAVRTPFQWRKIMSCGKSGRLLKGKVALFNDGLFGSATDLGTYGEDSGVSADGPVPAGRTEELDWQEAHMENLPNGGEAVCGKRPKGYNEAAKEMRKLHLSYLSSVWQMRQLEYWKCEKVDSFDCWKGLSGYDYIGRHLGYRFIIQDVRKRPGGRLKIVVENCGFAGLCEEAECILIMESRDKSNIQKITVTNPRNWKSGQKTQFTVTLPCTKEWMTCGALYLKLQRKRDGRCLYFANQGADDKVLIGNVEI